MTIKNIKDLSADDINRELSRGGKFVTYQFTISIIVMTFRRSSDIYFIKSTQSAALKGLPYTCITLFFGWWGIPWGPIYSIGSMFNNLSGGKNITNEILLSINEATAQPA